jgi:NADPH-dependent curcumin reductase
MLSGRCVAKRISANLPAMKRTQVLLSRRPVGMVQDDDLSVVQTDVPTLEAGQLLIRVRYVSLDPAIRGWMNAGTTYIPGIELGTVVRAFAAGEVVDSQHPDYPTGTLVTGLLGAQSYAVSDGRSLTKVDPAHGPLSWHLGILGMPGMTAYFGILKRGNIQPGETVFVSGAAGIVGATVGQIARLKGCRVVGTAGSDEKCRFLTDTLGFDAAINYKTEDTDAALKQHCPDGLHVYFDNVGGDILDHALNNLARGARVVICGAISQYNNTDGVKGPKNYMKIVTARGYITGLIVFDFVDQYPQAAAEMAGWLQAGQLLTKEDIDDGLGSFAASLRKLYTGDNFGKLLIQV